MLVSIQSPRLTLQIPKELIQTSTDSELVLHMGLYAERRQTHLGYRRSIPL
jgi:hypothetical protein